MACDAARGIGLVRWIDGAPIMRGYEGACLGGGERRGEDSCMCIARGFSIHRKHIGIERVAGLAEERIGARTEAGIQSEVRVDDCSIYIIKAARQLRRVQLH